MSRRFKLFALAVLLAVGSVLWQKDAVLATFQWKNLTWTDFERGKSVVYEKVGGDTAYFNVYENAAPGVEVGDNEPGTCDATSGYRGVLWYDTSGSDSGLKWCNNEDGSYNWDPIALDADGDGFSTAIDADDADDTEFARNLTAANVLDGIEIGPIGDVILTGTAKRLQSKTFSGAALDTVLSGQTRTYRNSSDPTRRNYCVQHQDGRGTLVAYTVGGTANATWLYSSGDIQTPTTTELGIGSIISTITCNGYY